MRGVKFNVAVTPYGRGDPALLPDDVAEALITSGEAEPYEFPAKPFAHEAGYLPPDPQPSVPAVPAAGGQRRDQKLTLRRK